MVMVKYPGTCRQCLSAAQVNSASDTASANQSSSQSSRSHKNSMFIDKLCGLLRELEEGPPRCPQQPQLELDKTQLLTLQIRRLLQQERQHMAEVEAAAKAALEAELLFCLLEVRECSCCCACSIVLLLCVFCLQAMHAFFCSLAPFAFVILYMKLFVHASAELSIETECSGVHSIFPMVLWVPVAILGLCTVTKS